MIDINTPPEVVEKIQEIIRELHDVCVENGVPLVIAALVSRTSTTGGDGISRLLSFYLDGPAGITDSSMLAASDILRMPCVPDSFIAGLEVLREKMNQPCDCPECLAGRSRMH
ncbi:hypothetical protein D6T17_27290 [Salmonella enterica subsp. enterica serovar Oranienburg]|uniref:Uncharacterized protein n=1 Tax=Salmonella enterica TaxID=28901 RepID=A0A743Z0V2_SALER|nr:hypothetical protein [Salmonella enterica subsp. enterica serovar Oranienburg]ECI9602130.1 hypothetical protein [Salmonella enterica]EDM1360238.1 hypothetical protein [Salmonella enterica subsp. enterica serovar Newport]EDQ6557022.1 hypothetical protein [Salmonella enterica subsp. enterica]EBY8947925.1 hypothetical protein [Salmonella enterica subsp. enterica serovar Oranienburg]